MLLYLTQRLRAIVTSLGVPVVLGAVCHGAEVHILDPRPPRGTVLFERPRLEKLRDNVGQLSQGRRFDTDKLEVLAWAAHADTMALPPALTEDIIVLVPEAASERWHVCFMFGGADGWEPPVFVPSLPFTACHAEYDRYPTQAQLIEFVHNTRFGNNRLHERLTVLAVFLYRSDMPKLARKLRTGISEDERRERLMDLIGTGRRAGPDDSG